MMLLGRAMPYVVFALHTARWLGSNAQDLTVPSGWVGFSCMNSCYEGLTALPQNTTSTLNRESREALASGAAQALFANNVDPSYQSDPALSSSPPSASDSLDCIHNGSQH